MNFILLGAFVSKFLLLLRQTQTLFINLIGYVKRNFKKNIILTWLPETSCRFLSGV